MPDPFGQDLVKNIYKKPLQKLSLAYTPALWREISAAFDFHGSFFQNVIAIDHNNFEIFALVDKFQESKSVSLAKLSKKKAIDLFLQWQAILEITRARKLNFIDFSRFQISSQNRLKFALALTDSAQRDPEAMIHVWQTHPELKSISETNYHEYYQRFSGEHRLEGDGHFLYDYKRFAAGVLNSNSFPQSQVPFKIKVKLRGANRIQKRFIKLHLIHHLRGQDSLFVHVGKQSEDIAAILGARIVGDQHMITGNVVDTLEQLKSGLAESNLQILILLVDRMLHKEEMEFIKFLFDFEVLPHLLLFYFGDEKFVPFDLELSEKQENLLAPYVELGLSSEPTLLSTLELQVVKQLRSLPLPISQKKLSQQLVKDGLSAIDSLIKKKYLIPVADRIIGGPELYKDAEPPDASYHFLVEILQGNQFIQVSVLKYLISIHSSRLQRDRLLLEKATGLLLEEGETLLVNRLLTGMEESYPELYAMRLARCNLIERNYPAMAQLLAQLKHDLNPDWQDEFNYLQFALHEDLFEREKADKFLKLIEKDTFRYKAHLIFVERLFYGEEFQRAAEMLQHAMSFFSGEKLNRFELMAKKQYARLLTVMERLDEAEKLLKNIFFRSEINEYRHLSAYISIDLGRIFFSRDNFIQAEVWYRKGLAIFSELKNDYGIVRARENLINIFIVKGEWTDIRQVVRSSLKYNKEQGLVNAIAEDYFHIATVDYLQHHLNRSLANLERAAGLFKQIENPGGLVECELLKMKMAILGYDSHFQDKVLAQNQHLLSQDQRTLLSIYQLLQKDTLAEELAILDRLQQIRSGMLQFELTALLTSKLRSVAFLEHLRKISAGLSHSGRNYYFYEFYYIYFNHFHNKDLIVDGELELFNEVYHFFQKNKRKISAGLQDFKIWLDEREAITDVFRSARLVGDYASWRIPEDFFKSMCFEVQKVLAVDFIHLTIFERGSFLFEFNSVAGHEVVVKELVARVNQEEQDLNLKRSEVMQICRSQNKIFYPYENTKVILWKLTDSLTGVLLLGFDSLSHLDYPFIDRQKDLLKRFSSLIARYIEVDYKMNLKLDFIIGQSAAIQALKKEILQVSKVDFSVLITGESGSGKELVAKGIHLLSNRSDKPFVPVNAAAIPENLLEAELFGYKKGAFTGAMENKPGLIEAANGGSLFLDEIADLPLSLQAKLLRVLQEKELRRVGENRLIKVDVRLICATNKKLKRLIKEERFREDLFFRIQDITLHVPPLRERLEDIPLLAKFFLKRNGLEIEEKEKLQVILAELNSRQWPGNVRELESQVKRIITFYPRLDFEDKPRSPKSGGLIAARENLEKQLVLQCLEENAWNKVKTAGALKVSRVHLTNLIKKYKLKK